MLRLGRGILGFADPKTSRAGDCYQESLHDTIKMVEGYADAIIIRHPVDGAPEEAAVVADVPTRLERSCARPFSTEPGEICARSERQSHDDVLLR